MQKAKKQTRERNMSEDQLLLKDRKGDKSNVQKNVAMNIDGKCHVVKCSCSN